MARRQDSVGSQRGEPSVRSEPALDGLLRRRRQRLEALLQPLPAVGAVLDRPQLGVRHVRELQIEPAAAIAPGQRVLMQIREIRRTDLAEQGTKERRQLGRRIEPERWARRAARAFHMRATHSYTPGARSRMMRLGVGSMLKCRNIDPRNP